MSKIKIETSQPTKALVTDLLSQLKTAEDLSSKLRNRITLIISTVINENGYSEKEFKLDDELNLIEE